MNSRRYRLAGVYGDKRDRIAFAQWSLERLRGAEPCVVLASCAEAELLARSGDAVISGSDGKLVAEAVSLWTRERRPLTEFVPDVARICAGAGDFVDVLAPKEYHSRIGGDMYWYNSASAVLRDLYDCAACDCFAASGVELGENPPENEEDDSEDAGEESGAEDEIEDEIEDDFDFDIEGSPTSPDRGESLPELIPGVSLIPASLSAKMLKIAFLLTSHTPYDRRTSDKIEESRKFLRRWPERYTRAMRALVVDNAPTTAGSIMSLVTSSMQALSPFGRPVSPAENIVGDLPKDFRQAVFVLSDTFRTEESGAVAVAACVRLLGGRVDGSVRVFVVSGRDYDVARTSRASVTLLNDSATDKAGRADCHIFLPGQHSLFETLVDEKSAYLLRRLPVEEPKNLEFGECLIFQAGEWSFRDDVLPEMPGETVSVRVERASGSDAWMEGHAHRWLEHRRTEAVRRRKEAEEAARRREEVERERQERLKAWGEDAEESEKTRQERPRTEWDDLLDEAFRSGLLEDAEGDEEKKKKNKGDEERKSA